MTLFVVLGLVAVVIGVLVAVAVGVRSMRAEDRAEDDDWRSEEADGVYQDPVGLGGRRSRGERVGTRRAADPAQADDVRPGYTGAGSPASRSTDDPEYGTEHGFGAEYAEYERAGSRGGRPGRDADHAYGEGYQPTATPAPAEPPHLRHQESGLGAAENTAGAARLAMGDAGDSRVHSTTGTKARTAKAGRRHTQNEQPKKRARSARGRGGDGVEGWNDTNWDRVSDEDYWAEMSADKPLASRTAQSAADLSSPDPTPKKRDARTDPELTRPEPLTATMAMPEFSASQRAGADPERDVPALPVRRSGTTPARGFAMPAASRPAGHASTDYADPNLALLASLGEPAADARTQRAQSDRRPVPAEPAATPPGGWAQGGPAQGQWAPHGQGFAAATGSQGAYHSAPPMPYVPPVAPAPSVTTPPPAAYGSPSYGMQQHAGHPADTPGRGVPAGPGHAAAHGYDTGPNAPAGLSTDSYGTAYATAPDRAAGPFGGPADVTAHGRSYTGSHAADPYGRSYDATFQSTGAHDAPSYGSGSYQSSYGATPPSGQAAPGTSWGPQDGSNERPPEGGWRHSGPAGLGGPASATPPTGYPTQAPNGYASATPATPPGTPSGGMPNVRLDPTNGYGSIPATGGFASGYLSSSALSARHGRPEPAPLTGASPANPYGSYVTDAPRPSDDDRDPLKQPRHRDTSGYGDHRSPGGYGDYGGGSR